MQYDQKHKYTFNLSAETVTRVNDRFGAHEARDYHELCEISVTDESRESAMITAISIAKKEFPGYTNYKARLINIERI